MKFAHASDSLSLAPPQRFGANILSGPENSRTPTEHHEDLRLYELIPVHDYTGFSWVEMILVFLENNIDVLLSTTKKLGDQLI